MKRTLVIALLLAGCKTAEPGIEVRTVEVPTPVACVDPADVPAEPSTVKLSGNAVVDVVLLAELVTRLRKWGGEQAALLSGCTK